MITVLARPGTVAMLLGDAAVEPSAPSPDPSREKGRRRESSTQDPPSLLPSILNIADHPALASADPQHSAAETEALQHASKAAVPAVTRRTHPGPPSRRASGRPRPRRSGL
jgi:hypothetical protein